MSSIRQLLTQPRKRRLLSSARDDRGSALLEFALSGLVFLATIFGIIEFGLGIHHYNMISDLAQEGARWASVRGANSGIPASAADVQTYVQGRAGFSVTVTTTPAPSTLSAGSAVTVQVQTVYTPLTGIIPHTSITMQSTAKMIISH